MDASSGGRTVSRSLTTKTPHRRTGAASSRNGESAQVDEGEPDTASVAPSSAEGSSAGLPAGAVAAR